MDRLAWLNEKRRESEERMDTLWAPMYDEHWGTTIEPTHRRFVTRLVEACPPDGSILDAACGTGKYWPILLASGRRLLGIDQSRVMLACAQSKFPQVAVEKLGLQELPYREAFDAVLCVDAMEFVPPEDWPLVLANFHRALKTPGQLYFTVELADTQELDADYRAAKALGLPVVAGESAHEGGYHYYPDLAQVRDWIRGGPFCLQEEATGEGYEHFWMRKG